MTAQTKIRSAAPADGVVLSGIAVRSKGHWGYSTQFMAACREELRVTADMIQSTGLEYYVATQGESTIGFYALASSSPQEWELEALFVEPRVIGTGAGKTLFHHAAARARASGASALEIQGDPHAEGFYLAMGATPVGFRESQSIPGRQLPVYRLNLDVNGECPGPHA